MITVQWYTFVLFLVGVSLLIGAWSYVRGTRYAQKTWKKDYDKIEHDYWIERAKIDAAYDAAYDEARQALLTALNKYNTRLDAVLQQYCDALYPVKKSDESVH